MRVIYIDSLFAINLAVNYLILLVTAKITAVPTARLRLAAAALLGAIYAVLAVFPSWGFLTAVPMRIVSGVAMVVIAFWGKQGLLRLGLIFFAVSAAFGGVIYAVSLAIGGSLIDGHVQLPISMPVLIVSFAICYGVMSLVFNRLGRDMGERLVTVEISRGSKSVRLKGLYDTGNSLTDPISGGGVFVAETQAVESLFSAETKTLLLSAATKNPADLLEKLAGCPDGLGFYLIPYTAVGTQSAFLLAFRPERVCVDGKEKKGTAIALSPTRVSDGGRYNILINGGT